MLDGAARHAASRGAPERSGHSDGAGRAADAGRPIRRGSRERTVHAADYHFRAGDMARSRELIQSALAACPAGPDARRCSSGWPRSTTTRAAGRSPSRRSARQRRKRRMTRPCARTRSRNSRSPGWWPATCPAASDWARASLRSAEQAADPRLIAHSLARIALFEFLQGHGTRLDLLDRAEALDAAASAENRIGRLPMLDPSLVTGLVLKWCDRLDEARLQAGRPVPARTRPRGRGVAAVPAVSLQRARVLGRELGRRRGIRPGGCRVADESRQQPMRPATLYSLALVRAHRGQVQEARELAGEALALCDRTGNVPVSVHGALRSRVHRAVAR